ncbi:MAG: hypothetical protein ABI778_10915, partial [Ignavibacteriota bacterium]
WEFAARSSRYREEAVFLLKELTCGMDSAYEPVSVMVYAEEPKKVVVPQKIQRNGFGKLSGLAKRVESITINQEFETDNEIDTRELIHAEYNGKMTTFVKDGPIRGKELVWDDEEMEVVDGKVVSRTEKESSIAGGESSIVDGHSSIVGEGEVSEEANSGMTVHFAPMFVPRLPSGRLIPESVMQPIHVNNYAADRSPVSGGSRGESRNAKPGNAHAETIEK